MSNKADLLKKVIVLVFSWFWVSTSANATLCGVECGNSEGDNLFIRGAAIDAIAKIFDDYENNAYDGFSFWASLDAPIGADCQGHAGCLVVVAIQVGAVIVTNHVGHSEALREYADGRASDLGISEFALIRPLAEDLLLASDLSVPSEIEVDASLISLMEEEMCAIYAYSWCQDYVQPPAGTLVLGLVGDTSYYASSYIPADEHDSGEDQVASPSEQASIPAPTTLVLMSLGLTGIGYFKRRNLTANRSV